jgi:hypothetical protein
MSRAKRAGAFLRGPNDAQHRDDAWRIRQEQNHDRDGTETTLQAVKGRARAVRVKWN